MGKNFCGFLGNGCVGPRMAIESIVSQGLYHAMVLKKMKIIQENEIEVTRVFISESGVILVRKWECFQISEK